MEEICRVIVNCRKYNNNIHHVAREFQDETAFGLIEMSNKMLNLIDKKKVSNLVLFHENFTHSNKTLISFNYEGRLCLIKEKIEWDYEDLVLDISPVVLTYI